MSGKAFGAIYTNRYLQTSWQTETDAKDVVMIIYSDRAIVAALERNDCDSIDLGHAR